MTIKRKYIQTDDIFITKTDNYYWLPLGYHVTRTGSFYFVYLRITADLDYKNSLIRYLDKDIQFYHDTATVIYDTQEIVGIYSVAFIDTRFNAIFNLLTERLEKVVNIDFDFKLSLQIHLITDAINTLGIVWSDLDESTSDHLNESVGYKRSRMILKALFNEEVEMFGDDLTDS
jgi:hypothetical protein